MTVTLLRMLRRFTGSSWAIPVTLIVFLFVTSWLLMTAAEPTGSALLHPGNYWWWFIVTASTVGYGDFFPTTTGGHVVGAYVIAGGIATLTTIFARIAAAVDNAKGRRMNGTAALHEQDHLVIVGYHPGRTERIIAEVLADTHGRQLVLCAAHTVSVNPVPDQPIGFVRGELTDDTTLRRACVHTAATVVIDAADDNEVLAVLVTVRHLTVAAHIVVALRDMERAGHLAYVHPGVNCVQWHHPRMLAEELQDPGMARIYGELMSSESGNTYSMRLPAQLGRTSFGDCQMILGQRHDAVLLAVETDGELLISPPWQHQLTEGAILFYVGWSRPIYPHDRWVRPGRTDATLWTGRPVRRRRAVCTARVRHVLRGRLV